MYNHRQRRDMEKKMGLLKAYTNLSTDQKLEISRRKAEAGKQIHLRNLQELENQRIQAEAESYAKQLQSWIASGKTQEEAEAILKHNQELSEARAAKKAAHEQRQKEEAAAKAAQKNKRK